MDTFDIVVMMLKIVPIVVMLIHVAPIMAWVERRGSAVMQNRLGPNRIAPLGLLYSAADGLKFIFKEDPIPGHVTSKFYYMLAPLVSLVPAFMTFAVVPFASHIMIGDRLVSFQIADLNVGLLYIFSVASLGVYGVIMSGWASNNKYAMLGGLRSSSQMISYELSLGLSVIGIVMTFSSVTLGDIVAGQAQVLGHLGPIAISKWGILVQPVAFFICLTAIYAETNRLPFDLPEGESEIVAGYHLEYGSMKFAIFMMAEMVNMFVGSALVISLFLGGYQGLGWLHAVLADALGLQGMVSEIVRVVLEFGAFMGKMVFFMWLFVWVRWTIPRFRYDQLMNLGWKVMLPLALLNIFATGVLIYYKVI